MIKEISLERKGICAKVEAVQNTNAIPIQFQITDYQIPSGAEARIYIRKPSGAEIYNSCTISDNSVIVQPTTQMYAETGTALGQIQIVKGGIIAASFVVEFNVDRNIISDSAIESKDEFSILDTLINQARQEITNAQQATAAANTAAETANTAASNANSKAQIAEAAASAANTAAENIQDMADNGDFTGSVTVGTVTTGDAGTQASVTNSGTAKDAVLNFTIPKGETGDVDENATVTFTEATTRENIASGEALKTLFGKIKKWFSDLGTAAFRTVANVLTVDTSGYVLDARQGKVLNDRIGTLSSLKTTAKSNVVAAVNEVKSEIDSLIQTKTYTKSITIKNENKSYNMGASTPPTGYTLAGILNLASGYGDQWQVSFGVYNNYVFGYVKSYYADSLTKDISCTLLFIKNS